MFQKDIEMSRLTVLSRVWQARRSWMAALGLLMVIWTIWFLNIPYKAKGAAVVAGVTKAFNESPLLNNPSAIELEDLQFPTPSPLSPSLPPIPSSPVDRPLILYAFFDTPAARLNLEFFFKHGLHDAADFLFILNGQTDAARLLPKKDNIRFVSRANDCYDLGAFAEILTKDNVYLNYKRYILMNASIRGPFVPYWSNQCWSDMYLNKLTEKTKLVGMTMNCEAPVPHIQSMFWALDREALETLLFPSEDLVQKFNQSLPAYDPKQPVPMMENPGINSCPHEYWKAVAIEVYATRLLETAGFGVDAMMSAYHGFGDALARGESVDLELSTNEDGKSKDGKGMLKKGSGYESICKDTLDPLHPGQYWGTTIHPFDTVFAKTNRGANMDTLERLTQWAEGRAYSSYDVCR